MNHYITFIYIYARSIYHVELILPNPGTRTSTNDLSLVLVPVMMDHHIQYIYICHNTNPGTRTSTNDLSLVRVPGTTSF